MRSPQASRLFFWVIGVVGLVAVKTVADEPGRSPTRLLPASELHFYLEYDGLAAHDAAWKGSAAHDILVKTPSGSTILDVERQKLDQLFKLGFPGSKLSGAGFAGLQQDLISRGFALASYMEGGESSTVFVLQGLGDVSGMSRFESILRGFLRMDPESPLPTTTPLRDRDLRSFRAENAAEARAEPAIINAIGELGSNGPPTSLTWWREKEALIIVSGPSPGPMDALLHPDRAKKDLPALHQARVSAVLDAIEAKRPNVSTLPAYHASTAEGRDLAGFEPSGLFFGQAKEGRGVLEGLKQKFPNVGPIDEFTLFEALDLVRAGQIVGRWGFRGKSIVTDVRFSFPDAWQGPLQPPGFAKGQLPPIPAASGIFVVGSLDLSRALERVAPLEPALIPEALAFVTAFKQAISEAVTPQLREEVLRHLGPTWSVYASPGVGREPMEPAEPALLVKIHDVNGLDKAIASLVSGINDYFRERLGKPGDPKSPTIAFERLAGPDRGYRLIASDGLSSRLSADRQPTVLIGQTHLALAMSPALARAAIAAESKQEARMGTDGELAKSLEALPTNLVFLSVGNPRDSAWPEALASFRESAPGFLAKFLGFGPNNGQGANPPPDLLEVLGVPKDARANVPRAKELSVLIHPSVLAATVEDRSFRVITLEALPFGCIGFETKWLPQGQMNIGVKFGSQR
jgi:hypothetical protein